MSSFTIQNLTPDIFKRVLDQLRDEGATIRPMGPEYGEVYTVQGNNITSIVNFDRAASLARVEILDKPFFIPASMIESRVRDAVERARRG